MATIASASTTPAVVATVRAVARPSWVERVSISRPRSAAAARARRDLLGRQGVVGLDEPARPGRLPPVRSIAPGVTSDEGADVHVGRSTTWTTAVADVSPRAWRVRRGARARCARSAGRCRRRRSPGRCRSARAAPAWRRTACRRSAASAGPPARPRPRAPGRSDRPPPAGDCGSMATSSVEHRRRRRWRPPGRPGRRRVGPGGRRAAHPDEELAVGQVALVGPVLVGLGHADHGDGDAEAEWRWRPARRRPGPGSGRGPAGPGGPRTAAAAPARPGLRIAAGVASTTPTTMATMPATSSTADGGAPAAGRPRRSPPTPSRQQRRRQHAASGGRAAGAAAVPTARPSRAAAPSRGPATRRRRWPMATASAAHADDEPPRQVEAADAVAGGRLDGRAPPRIQPATPRAAPTAAATTPTITPLATMTSRRWRSVAPMAASRPSWRWRRWATTTKPGGGDEPDERHGQRGRDEHDGGHRPVVALHPHGEVGPPGPVGVARGRRPVRAG